MSDDLTIHTHHHYVETLPVEDLSLAHSEPIPEHDVPKDSIQGHEKNPFEPLTRNTTNDPIVLDPPDSNLLTSTITIGNYSFTTGNATNKQKMQQANSQYANSMAFANLSKQLTDRGLSAQSILSSITAIGNDQAALVATQNQQITTQEGANTTFNGKVISTQPTPGSDTATNDMINGLANFQNNNITQAQFDSILQEAPTSDQDAIDKLNTATTMYKNGSITLAEFNEALKSYNTYMNARNATLDPLATTYNKSVDTFNSEQAANNATIVKLNKTRADFQAPATPSGPNDQTTPGATIPPIAPENEIAQKAPVPYFPTFSYPATNASALAIPTVTNPGPIPNTLTPIPVEPFTSNLLTTIAFPLIAQYNTGMQLVKTHLNTAENADNYRRYNLVGTDPLGQNAYISRLHRVAPKSALEAGGGVAIANLPGSEGKKPHQQVLISNAIYTAFNETAALNFNLPVLGTLGRFGVQLSLQSGLLSVTPGVAIVGTTAPNSAEVIGAGFAISNVTVVRNLINSGATESAVRKLLEPELKGKVNQKTINQTIEAVTTSLNNELLKIATVNAGIALKAPGLPGQIFGNTKGVNPEDLKNVSNRKQTLPEVLNNPVKQEFLTTTLSDKYALDTKTQSTAAQAKIDAAVNSVVKEGNIKNETELHTDLVNAFIAQGISRNEAEALANEAIVVINAEQSNQALNAGLVNPAVSATPLSTALTNLGISSSVASTAAQNAIAAVIENPNITNNQEFTIALQISLEQQGISAGVAKQAAQNLVSGVVATAPTTSPLLTPQVNAVLPRDQLAEELHGHVYGQLKEPLGPDKAREVADHAVTTFVGPPGTPTGNAANKNPSLIDTFNNQHDRQARNGTLPSQKVRAESYRDYIRPSFDLYDFSKKIQEPFHFLLSNYTTGVMYAGRPIPKNFQRPLDVQV